MSTSLTLDRLSPGRSARIVDIAGEEAMRRRLLDLGFVPETEVRPLFRAASGDPTAFLVRGSVIALRSTHAKGITVLPCAD